MQVELGTFPSSYIPTTTGALARNADVLTYPSANNVSNTVGTIYVEWSMGNLAQIANYPCLVSDSSTGKGLQTNGSTTVPVAMYDGTTTTNGPTVSVISANTIYKTAGTWQTSGMQAFMSGLAGSAGVSYAGSLFTNGILIGGGSTSLFGTTRNVRIYPVALSSAQLKQATT